MNGDTRDENPDTPDNNQLYIMDADGTNVQRVLNSRNNDLNLGWRVVDSD